MFGSVFWLIVIILTLSTTWRPHTKKVKDGRSKKGYREINDGTPYLLRMIYGFMGTFLLVTLIYWIFS